MKTILLFEFFIIVQLAIVVAGIVIWKAMKR